MSENRRVTAKEKNIDELLNGKHYSIDYYQRDYKWSTTNIVELLSDLEGRFFENFSEEHSRSQVKEYRHYFLGSVIISEHDGQQYIIDGQQRLTSITLLLIYLHRLQKELGNTDETSHVSVRNLIYSAPFGEPAFNIAVDEREKCLRSLLENGSYSVVDPDASVLNLVGRFADIEENFFSTLTKNGSQDGDEEELTDEELIARKKVALPYFINWLLQCVDFVEIVAPSDDEAYTIFETMNDRGMSLTPTEMLKGYLLANIRQPDKRNEANDKWQEIIIMMLKLGKGEDSDFIKAWIRAKYADTIRGRTKNAENEDFEKIGTQFHKWLRDNAKRIDIEKSEDFFDFILTEMQFFANQYARLRKAARTWSEELEHVFFNANTYNNFTLQYMLILAPLKVSDNEATIVKKIQVVSRYLDIWIARRIVNRKTLAYSANVYTIFQLVKDIRDLSLSELINVLKRKLEASDVDFDDIKEFRLHQQNRRSVHYLLARMTDYVERQSKRPPRFSEYISRKIDSPFEIEHIWANHFEEHEDEFDYPEEFQRVRNSFGGLVLIPRGINQSYGDKPYPEKLTYYVKENVLAQSLHADGYVSDPGFTGFISRSGLPFKAHTDFKKADLMERQELYRQLCEHIWSPARLTEVTG
jgi:uncharacterized protein with ParB-like and HNH nuclease domain